VTAARIGVDAMAGRANVDDRATARAFVDPRRTRAANCRERPVRGLTTMVNSIYNGSRFENVWLERCGQN
jgi:hypothetical protein